MQLAADLRGIPPVDAATSGPAFAPLGVKPEQLGRMGLTCASAVAGGTPAGIRAGLAAGRTGMMVRYAWPRREGEPVGGFSSVANTTAARDTFDSAAALAVVQRFLPDAFAQSEAPGAYLESSADAGIPAIALRSSGQVILATRVPTRYGVSPDAVQALQEKLPRGVRLSRFVSRPVKNAEGAGTTVLLAWNLLASRAN